MANFNHFFASNNPFGTDMELAQNTSIAAQTTATTNMHVTVPMTLSTSLLCDSTALFPPLSQPKTTAATIPSLGLPGIDIVIYEIVDNQQL